MEKSFRTTWAHSSSFIQPNAKSREHGLRSRNRMWISSSQGLQTGILELNGNQPWPPNTTLWQEQPLAGWPREVSGSEKQFSIYRESWSSWYCWICVTLWLIFFKRSLELLENTALEVKMKRKFPYQMRHKEVMLFIEKIIKKEKQCLGCGTDLPAPEEIVAVEAFQSTRERQNKYHKQKNPN